MQICTLFLKFPINSGKKYEFSVNSGKSKLSSKLLYSLTSKFLISNVSLTRNSWSGRGCGSLWLP